MEKFNQEGAIEGTAIPFEGKRIIFVPASSGASEVELKDPNGKSIGTVDVKNLKMSEGSSDVNQEELMGSSDFLDRYMYVAIIGGVLLGVLILLWVIIRLFRKKKK